LEKDPERKFSDNLFSLHIIEMNKHVDGKLNRGYFCSKRGSIDVERYYGRVPFCLPSCRVRYVWAVAATRADGGSTCHI